MKKRMGAKKTGGHLDVHGAGSLPNPGKNNA